MQTCRCRLRRNRATCGIPSPQTAPSRRSRIVSPSRIDKCVQQGNDWLERQARSEFQNYINGNENFALEFICRGRDERSELISGKIVSHIPFETPIGHRKVVQSVWKIGDKLSDHCGQTSCVISYGYKEPMFVENIQFVDEIKHLVPTTFAIGLKSSQRIAEFCPNMLGHSLLNFIVKPCCFFAERELDFPSFPIKGLNSSRPLPNASGNSLFVVDNLPKGMIEGASEIVNDVSNDQGHCVRDGFILFGVSGSFAGIYIRFNDVAERSRFAEEFVKLIDVFRGPINLERCAVCHGL